MQELFAISEPPPEKVGYDAVMHPGGRPSKRPRSAVGQRLAEARERAGLSQHQLAEKLNTTQTTIAYWERKATTFRPDVLCQLTQILDVSADDLLGVRPLRTVGSKPVGKARQLFDAVSRLPRRQQEKIFDILRPFVKEHTGQQTAES
jgi:transcriptional regulator with XRE-family HTH domain